MKKTFKFLTLTVLLSMVGVLSAFAEESLVGFTFALDNEMVRYKVLSITWGADGSGNSTGTVSVASNLQNRQTPSLDIPAEFTKQLEGWYNGKHHSDVVKFTVTTIEARAFENLTVLNNLTIPGTVTTIEEGAFNGITNVTSLAIGTEENPSELTTLGDFVFGNTPIKILDLRYCPKLDLEKPYLTRPFLNALGQKNLRMEKVLLPNEIEHIGVAFANLTNLKTLDLSNTHVTELVDGALENTKLSKVVLPYVPDKTVANIKIGSGAFANSPIDTLTINGPIAAQDAIDYDAFVNMPNLKMLVLGEHADLMTPGAIPCYYKDGVAKGAFPNSPDLEEVIIGGKVSANGAIAPYAFKDKSKLKNIEFKQDIAAGGIGESAFENAGNSADELIIKFDGQLTGANAIGKNAFKNTTKVKELTFGKDIAAGAIGESAFAHTGNCATVWFKGELLGAASIGVGAFANSSISVLSFDGDIAAALSTNGEGGIAHNAFYQMSKTSDCAATVTFGTANGGELLGMKAVGESAFEAAKIGSLTFNNDIAAYSIAKNAFKGITGDAPVVFNGNLNGTGAIYETAFEQAQLKSVNFKGSIKSSAIFGGETTKGAFHSATIKDELIFDGNIEGDGIQDYAFEDLLGNADIQFNGKLTGNDAIGAFAFASANAKKVTFLKPINYAAIEAKAFVNLNTRTGRTAAEGIFFKGDLVGENAIGAEAFYKANVAKIEFKNISGKSAICANAFEEAGNANNTATILIDGSITGEKAINVKAFYNAKAQSVEITGNVDADWAIYTSAFEGKNLKSLKIKGNIEGTPAIAAYAFKGNPLTTIDLAWNETPKTISATANNYNPSFARRQVPIDNLPVDIPVKGNDGVCDDDANENADPVEMPWRDEVNQPVPAIDVYAFQNVKAEGKTVLNVGSIKSSHAISAGAFSGAEIEEVNFNELMAPIAVANSQFRGATLKQVNFLKEFKVWEEVDADNALLIGMNAFKGTKVEEVNFPKVSVKRAIAAPEEEDSPFYQNGAELTLNFNGDVCTGGFGPYAFAGSNTVAINLNNEAVFEKLAFEQYAFLNITLPAENSTKKFDVTVKYDDPADEVNVYRAFHLQDFYNSETNVDIQFITVPSVKAKYTVESNAKDMTPYRMKFICRKYIKMMPADGYYFGFFEPQDEQYIIEKYQPMGLDEPKLLENGQPNPDYHQPLGATAGVYSAYYDDKTLVSDYKKDPDTKELILDAEGKPIKQYFYDSFGGGEKFTADLYLNPLRIQDKGKYVLNQGHTFIVTSSSPEDVVAYQSIEERDGGVQTFAGLDAWACNDLRWNPKKIWARYACCGDQLNPFFTEVEEGTGRFFYNYKTGKVEISRDETTGMPNYKGDLALVPGHEWAGEMSYVAVENDDIDFYGNQANQYKIFVAMADAVKGVAFSNAPMIPADYAYILVTDDKLKRIDYSSNNIYPVGDKGENAEKSLIEKLNQILEEKGLTAPEYNGDADSWFEQVYNIINAYGEENGYQLRIEDADKPNKEALMAALKKVFGNEIIFEDVPVYQDEDEDGQPDLDEEGHPIQATDENGDPVTKLVFKYESLGGDLDQLRTLSQNICKANLELELAKKAVEDADPITCFDDPDFINYLKTDKEIIAAARELGMSIDEYIETVKLPQLEGKTFSGMLKSFDDVKKLYEELIAPINEDLEAASDGVNPDDDLYKQYLAIKNGNASYADNLREELENAAGDAKDLAKAYLDYEVAMKKLAENKHADETFQDYADYYLDKWTNGDGATVTIDNLERPHLYSDLDEDEKALFDAAKDAMKALWKATGKTAASVNDLYNFDAATAAYDAYEEAKAAADDYAFGWYTKAVNAENVPNTQKQTYNLVGQQKNYQTILNQVESARNAITNLPCYTAYETAVGDLGEDGPVEAVLDDPTTEDVDESVNAATGKYLALRQAEKAKDEFVHGQFAEDVAALKEAIDVVPEDLRVEDEHSPARLNIIWTDRDERNDVVGIMEAVVKGKANAAVNNNAIYNLNGMRVKNATKGVFIQNGKKIIK